MTKTILTAFIVSSSLAFALGWFGQGYRIYAGMYEQDKTLMQQLPTGKTK